MIISLTWLTLAGCGSEVTTSREHVLQVTGSGSRGGSVTSEPAGIECTVTAGAASGDCRASYEEGASVTLTAAVTGESEFDGWSGEGCAGTGPCQVTMNQARTVTATFTRHHLLTASGAGSGGGVISSDPVGIGCTVTVGASSGDCDELLNEGTEVTLTAAPDGGSVFAGWSGGGCAAAEPCVTTMDQAQEVVATFTATLGIFNEVGPRLQPDTDSFIGVFSGAGGDLSDFSPDSAESVEGQESLRATVSTSGAGFAGWFVGWGDADDIGDNGFTRDMSVFAGGQLSFWARSPIDLEVGIRSGNVPAGDESSNVRLMDASDFLPDDTWQQVCLPLSAFTGPPPAADLTRVKIFFVVAVNNRTGDTGGVSRTFWIDDVRWVGRSCS